MLNKKPDKADGDSDDGSGFPLTPGTEANYKKIDEQYAKVMNQVDAHPVVSLFSVLV